MYKFVVLAAALACANAGLLGAPLATTYAAAPALAYSHAVAPAAITSQSANILRSYGNLGQVSTYSKTIDTPYSSVSKSDVRVSNPGIQTLAATSPYAYAAHASPLAYASPAIAHSPLAYASPAIAHAPLSYAAPIARAGLVGVGYSAAPAVAHISYDSPISHYAW